MARPPMKSADEKLRIVLAVLKGELSASDAARREWSGGRSDYGARVRMSNVASTCWPSAAAREPVKVPLPVLCS